MVIGLIAIFIVVVLIDYRTLSNTNKKEKVIIIYIFLMFLGFVISLLQIIDKAPPSPAIIIEKIVGTIVKR